jgi:alpha-1,2-mannosyltransferase
VAGDRWAAVELSVVLAATVAAVTALPGPAVGPIPSTGLVSVWPDAYLLLFLAVLATEVVRTRTTVTQHPVTAARG